MIKSLFIFAFLTCFCMIAKGQKPKFQESSVRLESNSNSKQSFKSVVFIPAQTGKLTIEIEVDSKTTLDKKFMLQSSVLSSVVNANKADTTISFDFVFTRDDKDDKTVVLKITAKKEGDASFKLEDAESTQTILIKPLSDSLSNVGKNGFEFWLYTGTNFDLLDGAKPKELNVKLSFLKQFKENSNWWIYLNIGKNRFFSTRDSFYNLPYREQMFAKNQSSDSITYISGVYNTYKQISTDNYWTNWDVMYELTSSKTSHLFGLFEIYLSLQNTITKFENSTLYTDTSTRYRIQDSTYTSIVRYRNNAHLQANYNLALGLMYFLSTEDLNFKASLISGFNKFTYPNSSVTRGATQFDTYQDSRSLYLMFRIEGTVLTPGVSIGAEAYLRTKNLPQFNVSVTKVLDYKQIATVFYKTNSGL